MQRANQLRQCALEVLRGMVSRELNRLDINIISYHIGRQDMSLRIIDQATRSIQYLVLNVLICRKLCQAITPHYLPVIQPTQEHQHPNANKQENEHLPIASTAQLNTHLLPPLRQKCTGGACPRPAPVI